MTLPRHIWSDPYRTQHATERVCWSCALIKVTRHEPGQRCWTEFWRAQDGRRHRVPTSDGRTPECARQPEAVAC